MKQLAGLLGGLVVIGVFVIIGLAMGLNSSNAALAQDDTQVAVLQARVAQLEHERLALQGLASLIAYETGLVSRGVTLNTKTVFDAIRDPGSIEAVADPNRVAVRVRNWYSITDDYGPVEVMVPMTTTFRFDWNYTSWPDWSSAGGDAPSLLLPLTLNR